MFNMGGPLGILIMRIAVFWGLQDGPLFSGCYPKPHILRKQGRLGLTAIVQLTAFFDSGCARCSGTTSKASQYS